MRLKRKWLCAAVVIRIIVLSLVWPLVVLRPEHDLLNTLVEEVAKAHLPVTVMQTGCIGMCALEPIVEVFDKDNHKTTYVLIDAKKAKDIVLRHLIHGEVIEEYTVGQYSK